MIGHGCNLTSIKNDLMEGASIVKLLVRTTSRQAIAKPLRVIDWLWLIPKCLPAV